MNPSFSFSHFINYSRTWTNFVIIRFFFSFEKRDNPGKCLRSGYVRLDPFCSSHGFGSTLHSAGWCWHVSPEGGFCSFAHFVSWIKSDCFTPLQLRAWSFVWYYSIPDHTTPVRYKCSQSQLPWKRKIDEKFKNI